MKSLSIITTCRDDGYESSVLDRFLISLKNNCGSLNDLGIEFEYINIEWNPKKKYLFENDKTKDVFSELGIKTIILDSSVVDKEGLDQDKYFEYYAKNTGIRNSHNDMTLITNADIMLSRRICNSLFQILNKESAPIFYRARYRENFSYEKNQMMSIDDLCLGVDIDATLCTRYSGDFLLTDTQNLLKCEGYDESNTDHRVGYQTHMDTEMMFQMISKGINPCIISLPYRHIYHGKGRVYENAQCNRNGYKNKPDWRIYII